MNGSETWAAIIATFNKIKIGEEFLSSDIVDPNIKGLDPVTDSDQIARIKKLGSVYLASMRKVRKVIRTGERIENFKVYKRIDENDINSREKDVVRPTISIDSLETLNPLDSSPPTAWHLYKIAFNDIPAGTRFTSLDLRRRVYDLCKDKGWDAAKLHETSPTMQSSVMTTIMQKRQAVRIGRHGRCIVYSKQSREEIAAAVAAATATPQVDIATTATPQVDIATTATPGIEATVTPGIEATVTPQPDIEATVTPQSDIMPATTQEPQLLVQMQPTSTATAAPPPEDLEPLALCEHVLGLMPIGHEFRLKEITEPVCYHLLNGGVKETLYDDADYNKFRHVTAKFIGDKIDNKEVEDLNKKIFAAKLFRKIGGVVIAPPAQVPPEVQVDESPLLASNAAPRTNRDDLDILTIGASIIAIIEDLKKSIEERDEKINEVGREMGSIEDENTALIKDIRDLKDKLLQANQRVIQGGRKSINLHALQNLRDSLPGV